MAGEAERADGERSGGAATSRPSGEAPPPHDQPLAVEEIVPGLTRIALPLPGLPDDRLLVPGSPVLTVAADELAAGGAHTSFLAPTPVAGSEQLIRVRNISAGGMLATLDIGTSDRVVPGTVLSIDVELPEGGRLPVKLNVIAVGNFGLRGSFIDISHAHAERFAKLVFAQERAKLAARSRRVEVRAGGPPPGRNRNW